jgi:hypothetical protein
MQVQTQLFHNADAITAETLARTTADGVPNTAISNNNGCNNSRSFTTRAAAITAEALAWYARKARKYFN